MMKTLLAAAVTAAALLGTVTLAHAEPGTPIHGTDVGLDQDLGSIAAARGVTDDKGNVTFTNLKPGRYVVVLTDIAQLKEVARASVTGPDSRVQTSEPIALPPAGAKSRTKVAVRDRTAHPLEVEIAGPAPGRIVVRLETVR